MFFQFGILILLSRGILVVSSIKLKDGGDRYIINKLIPHEIYSSSTITNNIAFVQIDGKITLKENVKKMKLFKEAVSTATKSLSTGWGYINKEKETVPKNLQMLEFNTVKGTYKKLLPLDDNLQVCVTAPKGKGDCYGDSGGPLVTNDKDNETCATDYPDVFAVNYNDWIEKNMK